MRAILTVMWNENDAPALLAQATALAERHRSHLVGLFVRPTAEAFIPSGDFGLALSQDYLERFQRDGSAKAERLHAAFDRATATAASRGFTAEWRAVDGSAPLVIGALGRVFDITILAQPENDGSAETEIMLEAALFETGRPILMVPPTSPSTAAEHVVIAWNGSGETARAMADGMPFVLAAKQVTVLTVDGVDVPGPGLADVIRYLSYHDVKAVQRHFANHGMTPGEAFLADAQTVGADFMIKGAYTQSRLRQMIFGGATRHILNRSKIPVLLAH